MRKRTLTKAVTKPASAPATQASAGRRPRIPAGDEADGRHRRAEREGAVDGQIGEVEDAEREEDAERDEGIDEAELDGPEEGDGGHWLGRAAGAAGLCARRRYLATYSMTLRGAVEHGLRQLDADRRGGRLVHLQVGAGGEDDGDRAGLSPFSTWSTSAAVCTPTSK